MSRVRSRLLSGPRVAALLALLALCGTACDAGPADGRFDNIFEPGSGGRAGESGATGSGGSGPRPGLSGNIDYPDTFLDLGRPPGPPERGYAESPSPAGTGAGQGEVCDRCAGSSDCGAGACVINLDTGEQFCATSCELDADCEDPVTEECVPVDDLGQQQCVPRLGTCYELDPDAVPLNPIRPPTPTGHTLLLNYQWWKTIA